VHHPLLDAGKGRRRLIAGLIVLGSAAAPSSAAAAVQSVNAQFAAFSPPQVDALPGDTVTWDNTSPREHTVTSDDGGFTGGDLPAGGRYAWTFTQVGAFAYHCSIHPSMTGEIDVRRVTLDPVPGVAVVPGTAVALSGRTADPAQPVRILRGDAVVTTVTPSADGAWSATVRPKATGSYRAMSGADASEIRRILVSDRHVHVRLTRSGRVAVAVRPSVPGARIILQQRLRERFGWWPERSARLDYVSSATFAVMRPARVRVILVDRDGWTALATSPTLTLGHQRRTRTAPPPMPMHH
jgi:plastocyanin